MNREQILDEARECVCKIRQEEYGDAKENFDLIARLWSAYLSRIDTDYMFADDVANMMILLKVARNQSGETPKPDSWIDIAGYAALGGEIAYFANGNCGRHHKAPEPYEGE